jgi:HPt (histidine-containing phosphotransfer) domain-containing protein
MGEKIRSLDIGEMRDIMEGDEQFMKDCFHDFLVIYRGRMEKIKSAIHMNNRSELEKTASQFKKILTIVSAHHASCLACDLELMARFGEEGRADQTFAALSLECERVRDLMEEYVGAKPLLGQRRPALKL